MMASFGDHASENEQFLPVGPVVVRADRRGEAVRSSVALHAHAANGQDDGRVFVLAGRGESFEKDFFVFGKNLI